MKKERHSQEIYIDEGEVDFKEMFAILKYYYKSILTVMLLTTMLAFVYSYFSTNIYQAETLIKLGEDKKVQSTDFMTMAMGRSSSLEDEMAIFRTRRLAGKALENINIGIRYFMKKNLKNREFYKDSPFVINQEYLSLQAMGVPIHLIPAGEEHFRLIIRPTLKEKIINNVRSLIEPLPADEQPIVYDKLHEFGKKIETSWFTITVQKIHELKNDEYYFTMSPNELMTDFIGKNLSVRAYSEQGAITVLSFQDNVPLRAKEILDALSRAYIRDNMEIKSESANRKLHFIDIQLEAIDKTLKGSAENLERYKATNIVVDLSSKAQLAAGKLSEFETQLYDINMQIDVLENTLNYVKTHQDTRGINITSNQQFNQNDAIGSIILEIQKATALHSDMSSEFKMAHPNVIKINRQLASLRSSLQNAIQSSLRTLNNRKQLLNDIIKENRNKMQSLPAQERKLARLTRNFMVNEKIYAFLLEKRSETAIIESSTVSETRIVEFAAIENLPIKPNYVLIVIVGFLFGLILGIALAMLRAYLDNTIKTKEDIENLTTLPIYGILPTLKQKVLKLEVFKDPKSPFAESYRSLRTNLQFARKENQANVILVTSTIAGEGKSTTAANLGAIFQMANYKSIVINLDLRKPTLHHYFDVDNSTGMSTYLSGKSSIGEIIQSTTYENLDIITSGPIPPNPSELILTDKLDKLLDELKEIYDYIFIDSAPLGLVTDTMHLMQYADISLIVFREDYAKKSFVTDLNNLVERHDLKHIGIVINSVDISSGSYGYGYGYGYGS